MLSEGNYGSIASHRSSVRDIRDVPKLSFYDGVKSAWLRDRLTLLCTLISRDTTENPCLIRLAGL